MNPVLVWYQFLIWNQQDKQEHAHLKKCVEYLSFGEALPSVGALRQQGVKQLHPLPQRGQQHGGPHRQRLNHRLMEKQTHSFRELLSVCEGNMTRCFFWGFFLCLES